MKYSTLIFVIGILMGFCTDCSSDRKSMKGSNSINKKVKPNILFIFTDDQQADAMGAAGNTYIKTPYIDKLADSGVRFTNTYVMGGHHDAICAPSRTMLMSGTSLYHLYSGFDMNDWVDDKVLNDVTTMPTFLTRKQVNELINNVTISA